MREHQESSLPAARPVDVCAQDFLAWARAREHVLAEPDTQSTPSDPQLAALAQQLPDAAVDDILDRALAASRDPASAANADHPSAPVHSLATARAKRRLLGGTAMLALAAAASLLLVIRQDPHEMTPDLAVAPPLQDPLRFRLDVHGAHTTMRGAPDLPDAHRFAGDDRIVLDLVPFERTRVDIEVRVFVIDDGLRRVLPWVDRLGDPTLGDREILGNASDLGPGEWRLELEAVERDSGVVRWRGATTLRIQTNREM